MKRLRPTFIAGLVMAVVIAIPAAALSDCFSVTVQRDAGSQRPVESNQQPECSLQPTAMAPLTAAKAYTFDRFNSGMVQRFVIAPSRAFFIADLRTPCLAPVTSHSSQEFTCAFLI
jgi:hypothetical protein